MKKVGLAILALGMMASASPYKSILECQSKDRRAGVTYCGRDFAASCTTLHPTLRDNDPLPDCCRAAEKNSKVRACGCRGIRVEATSIITHQQAITEYAR